MAAVWFRDDERGFAAWVEANAEGFLVNAYYRPSPRYLVLHKVACPTFKGRSGFTAPQYSKLCSDSIDELLATARRDVGAKAFSKICKRCFPLNVSVRRTDSLQPSLPPPD